MMEGQLLAFRTTTHRRGHTSISEKDAGAQSPEEVAVAAEANPLAKPEAPAVVMLPARQLRHASFLNFECAFPRRRYANYQILYKRVS